tara:strand:- start:1144 stop:1365 length:222 start_codon:yes stop_codon:yes gene_type:complete
MSVKKELLNGIHTKLEGERKTTAAELELFLDCLTVIPQHTDVEAEIDKYVTKVALIGEKIRVIKFLVDNYKDE